MNDWRQYATGTERWPFGLALLLWCVGRERRKRAKVYSVKPVDFGKPESLPKYRELPAHQLSLWGEP